MTIVYNPPKTFYSYNSYRDEIDETSVIKETDKTVVEQFVGCSGAIGTSRSYKEGYRKLFATPQECLEYAEQSLINEVEQCRRDLGNAQDKLHNVRERMKK